jgi:hypothetical protein
MTTTRPNHVDSANENAKLLSLLVALFFFGPPAFAQNQSTTVTSASGPTATWNTNPEHWERVLRTPADSPPLKLGKSDWTLSGPITDGLRRRRSAPDRSLGKRILSLPIVRLFVPGPMPTPPGGGRYLLWGDSDRPWITVAQGAPAGDPAVTHEAKSLISFGR